jgi:phosphoheptose isomerase
MYSPLKGKTILSYRWEICSSSMLIFSAINTIRVALLCVTTSAIIKRTRVSQITCITFSYKQDSVAQSRVSIFSHVDTVLLAISCVL